MKTSEIKAKYLAMLPDRRVRVLSLVAYNLTICARSANAPEVDDRRARHRLQAFNELLHTVLSQLIHTILADGMGYPDDVFVNILMEKAQACRCERDLAQAFSWSVVS